MDESVYTVSVYGDSTATTEETTHGKEKPLRVTRKQVRLTTANVFFLRALLIS